MKMETRSFSLAGYSTEAKRADFTQLHQFFLLAQEKKRKKNSPPTPGLGDFLRVREGKRNDEEDGENYAGAERVRTVVKIGCNNSSKMYVL